MDGYLQKWANIFSRYHKYYFWVQDGFLKYETEDKKKGPKSINLKEAYVAKEMKSRRKFKITTSKAKYRLKAESVAERDKWVAVL